MTVSIWLYVATCCAFGAVIVWLWFKVIDMDTALGFWHEREQRHKIGKDIVIDSLVCERDILKAKLADAEEEIARLKDPSSV